MSRLQSFDWIFRLQQVALALLVANVLCIAPAYSQYQITDMKVLTTGSDKLDVTFSLECSSVETNGALHVHVQPVAGPSKSDRELEIEFILGNDSSSRRAITHRLTLKLAEGQTATQGVIHFSFAPNNDPYRQRMQYWNVSVNEDGRDVEESRALQTSFAAPYTPLKLMPGEPTPPMAMQRAGSIPSLLHILPDDDQLDPTWSQRLSTLLTKAPSVLPSPQSPVFDLQRDPTRNNNVRHFKSLPEDWVYYLQFSALTLSESALTSLRQERPKAAEALKLYLAAGGTLLVVAPEGNGPAAIDAWLMNKDQAQLSPLWEPYKALPVKTEEIAWSLRRFARGRVIVLNTPTKNPVGLMQMTERVPPAIGLSTSSTFDESWSLRNLIASVGKPPVWTFCAIVLLFGIVLGPGLLTVTGWIGRRSLLILLVPLVSFGATLAIVTYQVVHDGFGTHLRISSVISVDEASGNSFVWARETYYSGWPPREGFVIPNDVFFRPVQTLSLVRQPSNRSKPPSPYAVDHGPEQSQWRGLLPAQEQKQFLVGHAAKIKMPIQVKGIDNKNISLRNLTDETLPFVLLRDGQNGFYITESLPPQTEVQLASQDFGELAGLISRMRNMLIPSLPPDLRSMGWGVSQGFNQGEVIDQAWVGNMAEQSGSSTVPPYGFVTVVRKCEGVFTPLPANTTESVHLISGSAPW